MGAGSESVPNLPESQPEAGPLPEVIVQQVQLPAGVAGPTEISFDVRCFVLPVSGGIVLIDTGMGGSAMDIDQALERLGAGWGDVSDVVLTHSHADHVGGLDDVLSRAGDALLWAGDAELSALPSHARAAADGASIRGLRVIHTPGHTQGHISLLHESDGLLFVGDAVGTMNGVMVRPPAPFTADPVEAESSLRKLSEVSHNRMLFSHGAEISDANARLRALLDQPSSLS